VGHTDTGRKWQHSKAQNVDSNSNSEPVVDETAGRHSAGQYAADSHDLSCAPPLQTLHAQRQKYNHT